MAFNYPYQGPIYTPPYFQSPQTPPYLQPQPTQQPAPPALKGWPVQSENDARNAMIDLDGSMFVFPDTQSGRIYTKQINPADFSPVFRVYQPAESPKREAAPEIVTISEFRRLQDEVDQLRVALAELQENGGKSRRIKKEADAE